MMSIVFGTVLPWLLVAVGTWLGYQLVRQYGRILLRLESIEKRLGAPPGESRREPAGLPLDAAAPDFELPDLAGQKHKLSEFRGKDALLRFSEDSLHPTRRRTHRRRVSQSEGPPAPAIAASFGLH